MGDRCYLELGVAIEDYYKHQQFFDERAIFDESAGLDYLYDIPHACLFDEESNYGGHYLVLDLLELKIPFVIEHANGASYGSAMIISSGDGKTHMVETNYAGVAMVPVNEDGVPRKLSHESVKRFFQELRTIKNYFVEHSEVKDAEK